MGTEQFCLRWNDFHSNITSAFAEIRDHDDFLDVTLVCEGETVKAHKLVLSACSPLFRLMLKKNSHPQPMIFLRGIRHPDMVSILNFMYNGEVNVNQEDLQNFLAAAEELKIKGLSQTSSDSVPKKATLTSAAAVAASGRGSGDGLTVSSGPAAKRPRPDSPASHAPSTPHSAKSPVGPEEEEETLEPPQLSVKREFNLNKTNTNNKGGSGGGESEEEGEGGNNLLDCLVQAQNFALQQGFEQNMSHLATQQQMQMPNAQQQGAGADGKNLLQFLGQNNVSNAAANALMMQRLLGTGYELHPLGSRKDEDPFSHIKVARSSKGWHCPQCIHISSTKGNLKSHILSGRHKTYTEKPFGCQYCDRSYGTKQSLQVHISTNHRAERDAEYQALSKSLGMKTFPEAQFYMKQEHYDSVLSPAALQQLQHQLQQAQVSQGQHSQAQVAATLASLSSQPSLTIEATKGPQEAATRDGKENNLPSCRMEVQAIDQANNKMEAEYSVMEDSEDEDEEPPLSIANIDNNSITTP